MFERQEQDAGTRPRRGWVVAALAGAILAVSLMGSNRIAAAQATERTGKQIVDARCIACHGTGAKGAPKIGDEKAWSKRASQGLSSLTQHAIEGIRQMPAHGAASGLSDLDLERAITYMVNQSGGRWAEPISRTNPPAARGGEQIVRALCANCHETGAGGAPKIGDRDEWIPRVRQGLDSLVRSAINGHGGMPPRGGQANLTDPEIRSAVVYMLNPITVVVGTGHVEKPASGQGFMVVGDTTVYFGVVSADAIRKHPNDYPASVYGATPAAPDQYYVTVALFDADSGKRLPEASVRARVSTPTNSGRERVLKRSVVGDALTYGDYFAMPGSGPFQVTVRAQRAGKPDVTEARFDYVP